MKKSLHMLHLFDSWRARRAEAEEWEVKPKTQAGDVSESYELFQVFDSLKQEAASVPADFQTDTMRVIRQQAVKTRSSMFVQNRSIVSGAILLAVAGIVALSWYRPASMLTGAVLLTDGAAGAVFMVAAGIAAIVLASGKKYLPGAAALTVAMSLLVFRSTQSTFFNDSLIDFDASPAGIRQSQHLTTGKTSAALENAAQNPAPAGREVLRQREMQKSRGLQYAEASPALAKKDIYIPADAPSSVIGMDDINSLGGSRRMEVTGLREDREKYGQYDENPRLDPVTTPLSTFSIDVDTGSYSNMRRFINSGQLPPKDSVRIEEYVNYFDYSYKGSVEEPFSVNFEIAPSPLDPGYHLLRVGIKARTIPLNNELGWNLVFLIDVSGSMNEPDKLPLVKQSLKLLAQNMRPVDRIALVTYAGSAQVVLDSTAGTESARILAAIESLGAGGGTNGGAGIELAYQIAQRSLIKGSVNRVVLATDGDFNVGTTSFDGLMTLVEKRRQSGITLTTLGFGRGNYQEHAMEQLADRGNGNYFYIDSFREARKVLESGLAANMQIVAKDVKLQMEFNPAVVRQYRLIGFDNRRLNREDFTNDAKDAGEIGSGHSVTAIYELVLQDSPLAAKLEHELRYQKPVERQVGAPVQNVDELGFLKMRYKQPDADVSIPLSIPVARSLVTKDASSDFNFAVAVAHFGEILRGSQFLGSYTLDQVIELARKHRGDDLDGTRSEFIKLAEDARALRQPVGR